MFRRRYASVLRAGSLAVLVAGGAAIALAYDRPPTETGTAAPRVAAPPPRSGPSPGAGPAHPADSAVPGVPSTVSGTATPTGSAAPFPATPGPGAHRPGTPPPAAGPPTARPSGPQVCRTGSKLVPTCGVLWGVAPGAHTDRRGERALRDFEAKTGRHQDVFHAYQRGVGQLFPTREQIALAREPGAERILFLNWKPTGASWAEIAAGDPVVDRYLDRLARHIRANFAEQFFFTVHHEAEDDVRARSGSGYTARDYAAMFRHVVQRLRAGGADNIVTVIVHLAYVPHTSQDWFADMYPGDDVVDWIGWDTYAYSDPGYGHGDFAELVNRRSARRPGWPGFYNWAVTHHPDKPLMVAEWGVWHSDRNPGHKAAFYRSVGAQIARFPRIKALVHFDTPSNQDGRDSRVDSTREALSAYRWLGSLPVFQVDVG